MQSVTEVNYKLAPEDHPLSCPHYPGSRSVSLHLIQYGLDQPGPMEGRGGVGFSVEFGPEHAGDVVKLLSALVPCLNRDQIESLRHDLYCLNSKINVVDPE